MENYLPPRGYWLPHRGDIGCLLVEILVESSWRSCLPPHCIIVENYCLLVDNFTFRPVFWRCNWASCVFIFLSGLVITFSSSSAQHFCCFLDFSPLTNLYWWFQRYGRTSLPTLRSDFVDLRKLVVTFRLLRFCALPCCYLHRLTSLLSFSNVTVGLLLYIIL